MQSLTTEQQHLVNEWDRIAREEFAEKAFTWQGNTPWENLELLAELGHLGINLPEEYGGGGYTEIEALLQIETIGMICPTTAATVRSMSLIAPRAIAMFGSDPAKETYLPQVTNADSLIAIAISEPDAGSDVQNMRTRVTEAPDGSLSITGEKIWVTWIPDSTAAVVWTKFPDDTLGTVIVDLDDPGVTINEHYTNMHGHTQTHFFMNDVPIPDHNVLVRGRDALREQLKALNWERCGTAIAANTIARCALKKALDYAQTREQFDQPISDFQGIQWKLADMTTQLEASRTLTYRAVENAQANDRVPDRLETNIAALYSAQAVEEIVSEALQIHGAAGYQQGHPLEYLYRWARGRRIGGGTDEIIKNTIASAIIENGLP